MCTCPTLMTWRREEKQKVWQLLLASVTWPASSTTHPTLSPSPLPLPSMYASLNTVESLSKDTPDSGFLSTVFACNFNPELLIWTIYSFPSRIDFTVFLNIRTHLLLTLNLQRAVEASVSEVIPYVFVATKSDRPVVKQVRHTFNFISGHN